MTWKIFWWSGAAIGVMLTLTIWASATATFLFHHPKSPDVRIVIDRRTGSPVVEALAAGARPEARREPRVVVGETTFNFGVLDPEISSQHDFSIQNTGGEALELKLGGTTCKCTISGISDNRVQPGQTATMTMQWNTGRYNPRFNQSAVVRTNDPLKKELEFTIEGQVRTLISALEQQITLAPAEPDAVLRADVSLFTQSWPDFEIAGVTAQLPGLKWTVEPLTDPPTDWQATAAKRLKLEFTCPAAQGRFTEQVRIDIKSPGSQEQPHHLYVTVSGGVQRRVAWYGPTIDERGIIELGNISQGKGAKARLLAKVRDSERDLGQTKVEVFPAFLKATFVPHPGEQAGLYDLLVELPDDVPPCQYLGDPLGRIRIETGHERVGTLEVRVSFAVVP